MYQKALGTNFGSVVKNKIKKNKKISDLYWFDKIMYLSSIPSSILPYIPIAIIFSHHFEAETDLLKDLGFRD